MRKSFHERRDLIVGLLNKVQGITCRTPGGAFYAWPNVTEACQATGCSDSEEFRQRLLHEAGVIGQGADWLPETAYTKLCWALGQGHDAKLVKRLMMTPIAGDISPRSPAPAELQEGPAI